MDKINLIIAYESGELDDAGIIYLFSELVKSGEAWSLQGHYGRTASSLIEANLLDIQGNILK